MRFLRNLISNFTRLAPKRDYAHVHDVQIKWERIPVQNGEKQDQAAAGSMSLNGRFNFVVGSGYAMPDPVHLHETVSSQARPLQARIR
jgi:hypothetical protein